MKVIFVLASIVCAHASITQTVDMFCSTMEGLAEAGAKLDAENMNKFFGAWSSLFTDKIDCSEDPYNPVLGFNLHGVSLMECQAAKLAKVKANPQIAVQMSTSKCIEKIIDEKAGTAALWSEYGNSGALHAKFHVRGAIRFSFEGDKISAYHSIYDTYGFFNTEAVDLAANQNMSAFAFIAMALLGGLASMAFMKYRSQKGYVLLEEA